MKINVFESNDELHLYKATIVKVRTSWLWRIVTMVTKVHNTSVTMV